MPIVLAGMVFWLTKDQSKTYTSNTTIYTGIATGSSIVSLEDAKFDMFGTRAAFDNLINIIKERNTIEEVGIRLFATHLLLNGQKNEIISRENYQELMKIVPNDVKKLIEKDNFEITLKNLKDYKNKDYTNFIYELLNYEHPHYSIKKISSKLKVSRIQSSDLIDISYKSDDPGICKNTLELLKDVFIKEYTFIKINQSDAVVQYFQNQLDKAVVKLDEAEKELLEFNRSNTIINYYEQTKHIASEKEHFDLAYLKIKMDNAAAQSVLQVLEGKMSTRQKKRVNNEKILNLRNELSDINIEIAMKTFEEKRDSFSEQQVIKKITDLKTRAFEIQEELRNSMNEQYFLDNTVEGIPSTTILEDWIDKVIEYESTKAQLIVGDTKEKEYEQLFKDYAPLGATMKRLERKIDVAEREYLSILHSLGLAKLKQQNIELNSNLKVLAEPLFPITAEPSKRKYLIIIAFILGFIIPAFIIIVLEYLDQNIKTQKRAENFIGLKVAAIFPNLSNPNKKIDIDTVKRRGIEIISRKIILNSEKRNISKPDTNLVFSIQDEEGKTMLTEMLINKLTNTGFKVLFLSHNEIKNPENFDFHKYEINSSFRRTETIDEMIEPHKLNTNKYDYIFIEIPGILLQAYPINLFRNINHSYIFTRANRAWTKSDEYSLKDILKTTRKNEPQIILNGVKMEEMENVLGDLPVKRSFFRKFIKNIFRLQFFSKNKISMF